VKEQKNVPEIKNNNFNGFSPKTFEFLMGIELNNNKAWFEENKSAYREYVLKPFQELVNALGGHMTAIDPEFEIRADIGKTISRIYRDIRFSKDKSPYRSSVWITFKKMNRDWKLDPCFFFEITPSIYRYGMGFYLASKETLTRLRGLIDEGSDDFKEIKSLYDSQSIFTLEGEKYKKTLDKTKSPDILDWYQRKDIYFMCTKKINEKLFSSGLVDEITTCFDIMKPFYEFLWKLKIEGERI
jgi:uncharacterized protein (TIGR02453 family)